MTRSGINYRTLQFPAPALAGHSWQGIDIVGASAGPTLAVIAGIHPNEVAGVEAAYRLAGRIDALKLRGTISVLPIVNGPGFQQRTEYLCPVDSKNINFSFPGSADGSFSEAIADAILTSWAVDADCLIDLHGGDLREEMARFVVCQDTGDPSFDRRNLELAQSFGADFLVRIDPAQCGRPGRSCTARATRRQLAVFAEGGSHGLMPEADVGFHLDGVLGVAAALGLLRASPVPVRRPTELTRYRFLEAPAAGWCRTSGRAGDRVEAGTVLAVVHDPMGLPRATLTAPESGYILWRVSHPIVQAGDAIVGLGAP